MEPESSSEHEDDETSPAEQTPEASETGTILEPESSDISRENDPKTRIRIRIQELESLAYHVHTLSVGMPVTLERLLKKDPSKVHWCVNQIEHLSVYDPKELELMKKDPKTSCFNTTQFEEMLKTMPRGLLITYAQLLSIRKFELAELVSDLIILKAKSQVERQIWAKDLLFLLIEIDRSALRGKWISDLRDSLCEVVTSGSQLGDSHTVEIAFRRADWPSMTKVFEAQKNSLTKAQLRRVILMAIWKDCWEVFQECMELGADLTVGLDARQEDSDEEDLAGKSESYVDFFLEADLGEDYDEVQFSPLHEVVHREVFSLKKLENLFQENDQLVNATDSAGNTLLHTAVDSRLKKMGLQNIEFLLKQNPDLNIKNREGKTVLQSLVSEGDHFCNTEVLLKISESARDVEKGSWAIKDGWSVLHILCAKGLHQHIMPVVRKGADPKHLNSGLTLIDMVVLQTSLSLEQQKKTLAVLLDDLGLGPFHASVVDKRQAPVNMNYMAMKCPAKDYVYPVERLLFPPMSTRSFRKAQQKLVLMLIDGCAVGDVERKALQLRRESMHEDGLMDVIGYF